MFNTNKIINLVSELEVTIDTVANVNDVKKTQIEMLFNTLNNEIISVYKDANAQTACNYSETITDIINEVISSTEKASIHNIMIISEKILLTRNIKHGLITYSNARLIEKYSEFVTSKDLKLSLSNDGTIYNDNLKKVIKKAKLQYDLKIINTNKELYNHLKSKSVAFLEVMSILVKLVIKEKKANKEG